MFPHVFRPARLANGEPTLACTCGSFYDDPVHTGHDEDLLEMHREFVATTLSALLKRDRDGAHFLTDEEYNSIAYAIERI